MYTNAPGHIVHGIEFISSIYTHIVVSYVHMKQLACGIKIAFEGHICCSNIYGYSIVNKVAVCCLVLMYVCSNVGLHVDYIISAVGYTCVMWEDYLFRTIWQ